jgi:hypothetical protein
MELTRRDALAALAGAGILGGGGAAALARERANADGPGRSESGRPNQSRSEQSDLPSTAAVVETLVAVAGVVYPSAVDGVREFVETFARRRLEADPEHRRGAREAVADLDAHVVISFDAERFRDLDPELREEALSLVGTRTAEPAMDGTAAERVRYYLVNDLLFALYSSPTGGRLVGIENPQGHPGGIESYRRGPDG